MEYFCSWCGKTIEEEPDCATSDTCEECEEFFEENMEKISEHLNELLKENEESAPKTKKAREHAAWRSYSLISGIQMFGGTPYVKFKDSAFLNDLH